ncbi:MAG: 30S ribosomal protein S2 [Rubrobacteraceae bacterium]
MQDTAGKVGIRELLEAGVHFGHQAKRWNPKMKRYIFAERAGVHIIDLDQTLNLLDKSLNFIRGVAEANRDVLFVGTKKQAQITIAEEAIRCGQPYVAERYIGGMLTNFQTIKPRIEYFKDLAVRIEETPEEDKSGKEWFALSKEYNKLRRNFAGITEMERLPGAVFIVDPKREELLIKEANRLKIPVVALTDSNCDPEVVDYVIPGNDDAIRSISLISRLIADAVISGRGEEIIPAEERPVPPVVEEAKTTAEEAEEKAAREDSGNGSAAVADSAGVATTAATEDPEAEAQEEAAAEVRASPESEALSEEAPSEEAPVEEAAIEEIPVEGASDGASPESEEEAPAEDASPEAPESVSPEEAVEEEAESKTGEVVDPAEFEGQSEAAEEEEK